jgi:signal transduction histidine kinase/ActR/RegA family two-component response regulator
MDRPHPEPAGFPAALARALFDEAGDALLLVDPLSERVIEANAMAVRLSECSRDELLSSSIRTLLRPEQPWQDWQIPPPAQPSVHCQQGFLLRTRTGAGVPIAMTIARLSDEAGGSFALFALRDGRERVEAQRRLQRSEGDLRRVLASVSDHAWSARLHEGRLTYRYLSAAVERLTGRPASAFLDGSCHWAEVVEEEDRQRWLDFRQRWSPGYSGALEYRLRKPNGSRTAVRESVHATLDEGGLLIHGVAAEVPPSQRDIDERQAQLRKLDGLARLAGGVAHDFNNLVTGVLGNVGLARLGSPSDSPVMAGLAQIEEITLRAADLCKQLAILAGKGGGGGAALDLNALARDAAAIAGRMFPPGVQLRLELSDTLPPAAGEEGQWRQAILHLLRNAGEAIAGASGEVVLATRPARLPLSEQGESLCFEYLSERLVTAPALSCLEVRDSGPGLAGEARQRLFDPYFSTRPGGRGLGLALVLGIVRGHQGGVAVLSTPGRGTTVRLLLPARAQTWCIARTEASSPAHVPGWRGHGAILLADDEEAVLDVAARLLASAGFEVLLAKDGASALELFGAHAGSIRLALVDWSMPRLNGEATLRELRNRAPRLPLVLMSGYPRSDVAARFSGLELAGYLQKPFRLPALLELLRQVLPSDGPAAPAGE